MSKLTRMQMDVLAAASAHPGGVIILPPRLKGAAARAFTAALIERNYASEIVETGSPPEEESDPNDRWSSPLVITMIGRRAIRCDAAEIAAGGAALPVASRATVTADNPGRTDAEPPSRPTKQALVLDLLARPDGASLAELITATGWLPHTMRAALVRLRQKGRRIERSQGQDQASRYRLTAAA